MLKIFYFLITIIIISCGPTPCKECSSTGKISRSYNSETEYEVIKANHDKKLKLFSSKHKYTIEIVIRNKSEEGGNFQVNAHAIYKGIGNIDLTKTDFIASGQTRKFLFNYQNKNDPDKFTYEVIPPNIVKTEEKICSNCKGKGQI